MDRDAESITFLDMTQCEPRSAISRAFEHGKWTAADYAIDAGPGKMLFCGPDTDAPPITLKLNAKGWHAIYVGTFQGHHFTGEDLVLFLKLTGDTGYGRSTLENFRPGKDIVPPEMLPGPTDITEAYWKSADLTGQDLIFHRPEAGSYAQSPTNITCIRLVPLSEAEAARAQRDRTRTDTRLLIANHDSGQHTFWSYASHQDMQNEFEALRDSDFKMILWGCSLGLGTFYPSKVGTEQVWTPGFRGNPAIANGSRDRYRRAGFDPLRAAVACAREIGIEIYPQVRIESPFFPPHHLGYCGPGQFYFDHPEWRCMTQEGAPARTLSQAFPEVRAKYVALLREWVEDYGADGVNIIFCRSWPYALFEEPVRTSFKQKYGEDILKLPPHDDRVLAHQASFLTQLLREARQMLDEVGKRQGRRLGSCYVIPGSTYKQPDFPDMGPLTSCRCYGMDVETWVKEGLVDHLVVHIEQVAPHDGSGAVPILKAFQQFTNGTQTQLYADLYPRRQSGDSMRIRAKTCYDAGVDGLCFWDAMGRISRLSGWAMHRVLGHRDELETPEMKQFARSLFRCVRLTSLDGYKMGGPWSHSSDG
jgi:uncharacterized lipoprotein YddW (UPF0748 family)